ncbi:hypothetical protein [Leptolyngbya sp. FACHB-541]|uniref:hypothetical protein n=1 Tax=Leptolyngbya sp. FACHB-541 TaxID=2692810 RepID=UPI0018F058B3|nr:hypothetical protein [Leptolyngbya sp. FACHB-541]
MNLLSKLRYGLIAGIMVGLIQLGAIACNPVTSSDSPAPSVPSPSVTIAAEISDSDGLIRVDPPSVAPEFRNEWTAELEEEFWQRANVAIEHYADEGYGNTSGENEKKSYPLAMFDFLAGNREEAISFLENDDADGSDHAHTEGIDYYFAFTLKGQIRKYFFFGQWLDPDYRQRMFEGAKRWTEEDPNGRSHPLYGNGTGTGNDWSVQRRGGWVDGRNTDNLRAMREVAVYLMAEETGNEDTRQLYKQKLQRYVEALYNIGMGEWDSENYHGHTFSAYLNLYDFAKDPEVTQLAKAALDWMSAAGAVKYYRGGFGGPTKRDYGSSNVVYGSAAARLLWHYFGDAVGDNPEPERDAIHVITSAYRPPLAVVALARREFDRPVEVLATKPTYENWKEGGDEQPAYWETTFFGQTYQMGSVAADFADGDVGPFKLMADNSERGVDYFVVNTGGDRVEPGKREGDQIGQYRNLLIWLRPAADTPFHFQIPKTAQTEIRDNIWFFQLENTWLAIHPINLSAFEAIDISDEKAAELYTNEQTLRATIQGNGYAGFALEVGEPDSHGSYAEFKQNVVERSQLTFRQTLPQNFSTNAQDTVQFTSSTDSTLRLTHNPENELPQITRNGEEHNWSDHFALYQPTEGNAPISLGWKQGTLRVEAGDEVFESSVVAGNKG